MPSYDVIIIGGGIAGLAAAKELSRARRSFVVLEAKPRLGGRVWTVHNDYCHPIEMGAEFIHGRPPEIFDVVDDGRLRVIEGREGHMSVDNGRRLQSPGDENPFSQQQKVMTALHRKAMQMDESFADFASELVTNTPELAGAIFSTKQYVEGYNASDAEQVSIQWLSLCENAADAIDGDDMFRFVNGYSTLVTAFSSLLPEGSVLLNHRVDIIEWQSGNVTVQCSIPGPAIDIARLTDTEFPVPWKGQPATDPTAVQTHQPADAKHSTTLTLHGRCALITLPVGVLQASPDQENFVKFLPPLPPEKVGRGKIISGNAIRLILQFKHRFWEKRKLSDDTSLEKLNFLHCAGSEFSIFWTQLPVRAPLLVCWIGGRNAEAGLSLSLAELTARALQSLSSAFKLDLLELENELETAHYHDWHSDPFARGAYSYVAAGGMDGPAALAATLDSTLFFAGEATDTEGFSATVHGAIRTGQRAAREILTILP